MIRNWIVSKIPKNKNMVRGDNRSIEIPPARFPKTPPIDPATHANDGRSDVLEGSFPHSATTASFATSTMDAPRLLRRR